jgi:hypothetical protein
LAKVTITLRIKPISINAYYRNSRTGKRIKTGEGLAFDEELNYLLEEHASALAQFGRKIDPSKNIVKSTMLIGNPGFFIKDGSRVSQVAGDVDNWIKVTQDKVFQHVGVDDYIVRNIVISDVPCVEAFTEITLETLPIPQSFDHTAI